MTGSNMTRETDGTLWAWGNNSTGPLGRDEEAMARRREEDIIVEKHREDILEYLKAKYPEEFV